MNGARSSAYQRRPVLGRAGDRALHRLAVIAVGAPCSAQVRRLDLDGFLTICHDGVDAGVVFAHGEPYPNTAEAFHRIKSAGHTIHVVTDRSFGTNGKSEAHTRTWLDHHGLPFDSLTFSADKTVVRLDVPPG